MKLKMIVSLALLLLFFSLGSHGNFGGSEPENEENNPEGEGWRDQKLILKVVNHHNSEPIPGVLVSITTPGLSLEADRSNAHGRVALTFSPIHDFSFRFRASHPDFQDLDWHLRGEWLSRLHLPLIRMVRKDALRTWTVTYDCPASEPVYMSWSWQLVGDGLFSAGKGGSKLGKSESGRVHCVISGVPVDAHLEIFATGQYSGEGDFFAGVVRDRRRLNQVSRMLVKKAHRGRVEDKEGCAIEGAQVRLILSDTLGRPFSFQGNTDELGEFEIAVPAWLSQETMAQKGMMGLCDIVVGGTLVPGVPLRLEEGRLATIRLNERSDDLLANKRLPLFSPQK